MTNLVEGLGEVHYEHICLFAVFQVRCDIICELKQLSLTGSSLPEAVLHWVEDVVSLTVIHDMAGNDVFHQFAAYARQRYWTIIDGIISAPFFEDRCYVCFAPVTRHCCCVIRELVDFS